MSRPLTIAAAQFPVSDDLRRNARHIHRQIAEAAARGAGIVQFPETALPGYVPRHRETLADYDWDALTEQTELIRRCAADHRIQVVLGSIRPVDGARPRICLHVISARGEVVGTYDKRRLYGVESEFFSSGDGPLVMEIGGHRCGFLICYENCFPELYGEYRDLGVGLVFHSFYNAANRRATSIRDLMRASLIVRAADAGICIAASNSSRRYSPLAACIVRPDGSTVSARRHVTGLAMDRFPSDDLGWTYNNRGD